MTKTIAALGKTESMDRKLRACLKTRIINTMIGEKYYYTISFLVETSMSTTSGRFM
jgi:hypothetical protein